jgi:hypothetical protein
MNDFLRTFDLSTLGIKDMVFIAMATSFILEQVFYWFFSSYPYRYGILVKRITIPAWPISFWDTAETFAERLAIRKRDNGIYVRYKYPFSIIGPHFFVGQITFEDKNELKIRIGFFSALFVMYLAISPLSDFRLYSLWNSLTIVVIICWLYISFYSGVKQLIRKGSIEKGTGINR